MRGVPFAHALSGSIRSKILLTNAIVLVLMIGASHLVTYLHWRSQLLSFARDQGFALAASTAQVLREELLHGGTDDVRKILRSLTTERGVWAARVTDGQGHVLLSSDPREERIATLPLPAEVRGGRGWAQTPAHLTPETKNLSFYIPITRGPDCAGCHYARQVNEAFLQIDVAAAKLGHILALSTWQAVLVAVLTILLLFYALLALFRAEVNQPVSEILAAMRRVQAGDLSARVTVRRQDEMGTIATELNTMVEQVGSAREELRKLHEHELERQERLATIGNLAAGVAHEIKNPLAGIRGAMEVLAQGLPSGDPKNEVIAETVREVDRLNRTVRDLLYYSRVPQPEAVPSDLDVVVEEVLGQARQLPGAAAVDMAQSKNGPVPAIALDYQLVKLAFMNIIQNAIDAMPHGGHLRVRTWSNGGRASVSFVDDGPGMDAATAAKVMQPFFTTRHRGTGLGLPIAKSIVEAHGGDIQVQSAPGRGSEFVLSFPALTPARGSAS